MLLSQDKIRFSDKSTNNFTLEIRPFSPQYTFKTISLLGNMVKIQSAPELATSDEEFTPLAPFLTTAAVASFETSNTVNENPCKIEKKSKNRIPNIAPYSTNMFWIYVFTLFMRCDAI